MRVRGKKEKGIWPGPMKLLFEFQGGDQEFGFECVKLEKPRKSRRVYVGEVQPGDNK